MTKETNEEIEIFSPNESVQIFDNVDDLKRNVFRNATVSEIESIFNAHRNIHDFKWSNNPFLPCEDIFQKETIYLTGFDFCDSNNFFKVNPLDFRIDTASLGICKINEEIGYGLVATKAIPKGRWLIFNGITSSALENYTYCENNPYVSFIDNRLIDTKHCGGFSSLILSSTNKDLQSEIEQKYPDDFEILGLENIEAKCVKISGVPQIVLVTNKDIEPNELIFCDYGKSYYLQFDGPFIALNKDGSIASCELNAFINDKLDHYIINRGTEINNDLELCALYQTIGQQQLANKNTPAPRIFHNREIFIIYPESFADLVTLAKLSFNKELSNTAREIAKFTQIINEKYNLIPEEKSLISRQLEELQDTISQKPTLNSFGHNN